MNSRQKRLLQSKKQYNRVPGLIPIYSLINFLEKHPRLKEEIPYQLIDAILYSIRTPTEQRRTDIWKIVKRSWPIGTDWTYIAAYGNPTTLNINLVDFKVLWEEPYKLTNQYSVIKNYLLKMFYESI